MLAMQPLLFIQGASEAVEKSACEKAAKDDGDDGVDFWAAPLRVIKAWAAIVDVFASHEQTRERAHAQQYAVGGIPCQRFFLLFFFFLGLLVTLLTVST